MIRLISDTGSLYSPEEAKKLGFNTNPLIIHVDDKEFEEYDSINSNELLKYIENGFIPKTSQPSIGKYIDLYEKYKDDEIIVLSMADGLSGTYQSSLNAKNDMQNSSNIHVFNTKTLCGPQKYLVEMTLKLINDNEPLDKILKTIEEKIETSDSFLIPNDFDYLKRGGRLNPIASKILGFLNLTPIIKQSKDGKVLDKFDISKNFNIAIKKIINFYSTFINEKYNIYITHAFYLEKAMEIKEKLQKAFPNTYIEINDLSCNFICHGGPKAISIQSIMR